MLLISLESVGISSWYFLKTKTPIIPSGDNGSSNARAVYPRLRNRFLFTASFATLLGAIKDIFTTFVLFLKYLKVRLGEFKKLPLLKISSTSLVVTLFFLGSMIKQKAFFCLSVVSSSKRACRSLFENEPRSRDFVLASSF